MSAIANHTNASHKPPQPPLKLNGTTAWAFAGQGSQASGMGRDIYEQFDFTRDIFESAAAGFDLKKMCFEASAEELGDTRYTQACMAAFAAAVSLVLCKSGLKPSAALGLSLGEYCALSAVGVFSSETLLSLLGFRGSIMADASKIPSRMTAVLGLDDETVESTVAEIAKETGAIVSCTNYNTPAQVVIGGDEAAVEAAEKLLMQRGARRCMPLKTSGPFHTQFMKHASGQLAKRLEATCFNPQNAPVIFNVTAAPAPDDEIPELLVKQIYSPVRFAQSIRTLEAAGIAQVIEIGPGRVLAGLIKKTAPSIAVHSIEKADDLRKVIEL